MKKNIIFLSIVAILTVIVWYKIYFQSFQGEGYYFFDPTLRLPCSADLSIKGDEDFLSLCRYDNFARIIYYLFKNAFLDNLRPYLSFIIITQVVLSFCIYFLTKKITKNKLVAFLAGIFFSVNYVTNFEMTSIGNYQWFAQRVPNFIFTLISIIFYYQFLAVKKYRYYFLALGLFLSSVFLAHVSMFLLPVIIFSTLFYSVFNYKFRKETIFNLLLLIPFIAGTMFILSQDPFAGKDGGFVAFLAVSGSAILGEIFFQITMITVPYELLVSAINYLRHEYALSIRTSLELLYIPVVFFYAISIILVYKFRRNWMPFLLTCFLSMMAIGMLNLYTNRVTFIYQATSSRYFFPLGFLVSIYLAIVLYLLLWRKNIIKRIFLILFIVFWVYSNIKTIWAVNDENQYKHIISHNVRAYVKNISPNFKKDSLVILPPETGAHEATFLKLFYGKESMNFVSFVTLTEKEVLSFNPEKDFLIVYDKREGSVENATNKYQEIFKENNLIFIK